MWLSLTAFISPSGGEFLLIMLVLILLFGAKDAPRIFRSLHTMLDKIQRTAASFRYRIMYGDLYEDSGTKQEAPYNVEGHDTEDVQQESDVRDGESADSGQASEVSDQNPGTQQ